MNAALVLSARVSAVAATLLIVSAVAQAKSETAKGGSSPGGGDKVSDSASWDFLKASKNENANSAVLDGEAQDFEAKGWEKTNDKVDSICKSTSGGLCEDKIATSNALIAASRATGVPGSLLACTAKLESGFGTNMKNPTSSASGLAQFIEGTAKAFETKMQSNKDTWGAVWDVYKKILAEQKPPITNVPEFTAENIRQETLKPAYLTQIFAMALLVRDAIDGQAEKELKDPEKFLEYAAIAHVEGKGMAKKFLENGSKLEGLPLVNRKQAEDRLKQIKECVKRGGGSGKDLVASL